MKKRYIISVGFYLPLIVEITLDRKNMRARLKAFPIFWFISRKIEKFLICSFLLKIKTGILELVASIIIIILALPKLITTQ